VSVHHLTAMRLPDAIHDRFRAIVGQVARHGHGCAHLESEPTGLVCVQHPRLVRCSACTQTHITGHNVQEERHCDICSERLDRPDSAYQVALAHPVEVDTTVSIGRGRRAAVGIVWLFGWAACETCMPELAVAS
jgi:hypothetical protein